MQINSCFVCSEKDFSNYCFKEKMFGLNRPFEYIECNKCGTLSIKEYPNDIHEYYQIESYYSLNKLDFEKEIGWKRILKKIILNNRENIVIQLLFKERISFLRTQIPWYLKEHGSQISILDIGSGEGDKLNHLYKLGYSNLLGVDKFIIKSHIYSRELKILKDDFYTIKNQKFDIIILSHVLEHLPNQENVFKKLKQLLDKDGRIVVSIPIKEKAWNDYKENWVQLDAPRHFHIYRHQSFLSFLRQLNLVVENFKFDSSAFQFWGSELYKNNIPLINIVKDYSKLNSFFTENQLNEFSKKSKLYNENESGDSATYVIKLK